MPLKDCLVYFFNSPEPAAFDGITINPGESIGREFKVTQPVDISMALDYLCKNGGEVLLKSIYRYCYFKFQAFSVILIIMSLRHIFSFY